MNHALVVGGTRGAGRAAVRALARKGFRVSVIGRRPPEAEDRSLPDVTFWAADVSSERALVRAAAQLLKKNGPLDHLVFYQQFRGAGDEWAGALAASLDGTRKAIERLAPKFEKAGGSIVVVNSIAGRLVAPERGPGYHVSKAGLLQLVRYYAVALGPKGIRVNSVSPGSVLKDEAKGFYEARAKLKKLIDGVVPLGRMGTPGDVAEAVLFLLGPGSSFITGQDLAVDGGLSLLWQESLARKVAFGGKYPVARSRRA